MCQGSSNSQNGGLACVGWNQGGFLRAVGRSLWGNRGGWERGAGYGLHCTGNGAVGAWWESNPRIEVLQVMCRYSHERFSAHPDGTKHSYT